MNSTETDRPTEGSWDPFAVKCTRQTLKLHLEKGQQTNKNKTKPKTTTNWNLLSATHRSLSTQQAQEAHTEKDENLGCPSSHQRDNTVPLLLFLHHNKRAWVPQLQPSQPPPLVLAPPLSLPPPLPPLLLPQLPQHPPLEEQLSPELMSALGTLWQPPCEGQVLGLRLEEEVAEEEEVEAEGNQLLSLCSNSSPSQPPQTYKLWERSPASSKEKETKLTPS